MIPITKSENSIIPLFRENKTSAAVSDAHMRISYVEHAVHVYETDADATTATVVIEASSGPTPDATWAPVTAALAAPSYTMLPRGPYFALRARKSATTRGVTVNLVSSRSSGS